MKNHEDLARIRVNDAVQEGLRSQAVRRARRTRQGMVWKVLFKQIQTLLSHRRSRTSQPKSDSATAPLRPNERTS